MAKSKQAKKTKNSNDLEGGWRRVTPQETEMYRQMIENTLGAPRGRPTKDAEEKYKPISIRLHPAVIEWAKREAKKRGVGYQTIINEVLLKAAA